MDVDGNKVSVALSDRIFNDDSLPSSISTRGVGYGSDTIISSVDALLDTSLSTAPPAAARRKELN
jgi:hypothetical protein